MEVTSVCVGGLDVFKIGRGMAGFSKLRQGLEVKKNEKNGEFVLSCEVKVRISWLSLTK